MNSFLMCVTHHYDSFMIQKWWLIMDHRKNLYNVRSWCVIGTWYTPSSREVLRYFNYGSKFFPKIFYYFLAQQLIFFNSLDFLNCQRLQYTHISNNHVIICFWFCMFPWCLYALNWAHGFLALHGSRLRTFNFLLLFKNPNWF